MDPLYFCNAALNKGQSLLAGGAVVSSLNLYSSQNNLGASDTENKRQSNPRPESGTRSSPSAPAPPRPLTPCSVVECSLHKPLPPPLLPGKRTQFQEPRASGGEIAMTTAAFCRRIMLQLQVSIHRRSQRPIFPKEIKYRCVVWTGELLERVTNMSSPVHSAKSDLPA